MSISKKRKIVGDVGRKALILLDFFREESYKLYMAFSVSGESKIVDTE